MSRQSLKKICNLIGIFMILFAEICLYIENTISIYKLFVFTGIFIVFICNLRKSILKIKKDNLIIWLTIVYSMFVLYGIFYLKNAVFPLSSILIRYFENLFLYIGLKNSMNDEKKTIKMFTILAISMTLFLLSKEIGNILAGNVRIGNSISDNVNVVGFNFGIISTIILWSYQREKKLWKMLLFVVMCIIMLVTGSKKAVIIILINIFMLFLLQRKNINSNNIKRWLKLVALFVIVYIAIFKIPYFYNAIGRRLDSMFLAMSGEKTSKYLTSTEERSLMIKEGFGIFLNHPIIGGGWGNFASHTIYGYNYSHNNYIELLCSFGIIGFAIFYSQHLKKLFYIFRRIFDITNIYYEILVLAFTYVLISLISDWGAVSFLGQCTYYLPIIISGIIVEKHKVLVVTKSNE